MKIPAFVIPTNISQNQQVAFLLRVINLYRKELLPLRQRVRLAAKKISRLERQIRKHIEDCQRLKQRITEFEKDVDKLKKEKGELEQEIERLTKTNKRLTTALFDHGNLKSSKKSQGKKRNKGGQLGHSDTNRENQNKDQEDISKYSKKRLSLKTCPYCNHQVNSVNAIKNKILIDIVINPQVTKLLLQLERQWCPACQKEVKATHSQSLPFTEYGINTLMLILLLRFKANLSLNKVALVLETSFGLTLATSSIQALLAQAKSYLGKHYQALVKKVREGKLMYNDETGWLIGKSKAWIWIMANQETTVYYAAESRGHGIFKAMYGHSQALSMHDGLTSYQAGVKNQNKHAFCWAHFLRYVHEESNSDPPNGIAKKIKKQIIKLYRLKQQFRNKKLSKKELEQKLEADLTAILEYKSRKNSVKNIQTRLTTQKQGLIKALTDTPDGTNNLAERELRPMVLLRKTTNGSNTFNGMEVSTTLASVVQTLSKQEDKAFFPNLQNYIQAGVSQKYPSFGYS